MRITGVSLMHHVFLVMLALWLLCGCHLIAFIVSFLYLYSVHDGYFTKLKKKLQFEMKRNRSSERTVGTDSETVSWLNYAVKKIWHVCLEEISSQTFVLPIIAWFLDTNKPSTVVLKLGVNFLSADDMSAIFAVKLRNPFGFRMGAELHTTSIHVEGKVLIRLKFIPTWPFLGRLRVCFTEPPYFQMNLKPISTAGLDVTELPGISGWLDNYLSVAFEETLVAPRMLVVHVEKLVAHQQGGISQQGMT